MALLVFLPAAGLLVLSPARPLFPAQSLLAFPAVPERVRAVYAVYRGRNDAFAPVRTVLPPDLKVLGLVTFDDPETSLWRPFGGVHVEHVCPADTQEDLQRRDIQYVVLNDAKLQSLFGIEPDVWRQRMNAQVVGKVVLNLRAATGPLDWVVLKLPPAKLNSPSPP